MSARCLAGLFALLIQMARSADAATVEKMVRMSYPEYWQIWREVNLVLVAVVEVG